MYYNLFSLYFTYFSWYFFLYVFSYVVAFFTLAVDFHIYVTTFSTYHVWRFTFVGIVTFDSLTFKGGVSPSQSLWCHHISSLLCYTVPHLVTFNYPIPQKGMGFCCCLVSSIHYYYVSPRRGIRFVFDPVSDLSLSLSLSLSLLSLSLSLSLFLSLCHFLPSFWNNSATVREGVTKFEMPQPKLLNKCLFLFIAPFDLWPLPWHECANLCCDHDNWRKIAWIAPKFACRLFFTQGSDKFETSLVELALSRWRPI